jgi:hypothetical protein
MRILFPVRVKKFPVFVHDNSGQAVGNQHIFAAAGKNFAVSSRLYGKLRSAAQAAGGRVGGAAAAANSARRASRTRTGRPAGIDLDH